jgi:hypothetical protein
VRAVNLIPADQRAGAAGVGGRSGGGAYAVLALVGGLGLLALLYGLAHRQISSRRAQVVSLKARAEQAQATAAGLAPYTSFVALREERERAVSQLVDSRFDWAHAFHEVGRVLPTIAAISSIDGSVGSSSGSGAASASSSGSSKGSTAVASATPPGTVPTVTLSGCATSQAAVALTLNRLRLIDGVSDVTLQSSTKTSSGSAGGAAAGPCPPRGPAFTTLLTFDPLPPASALGAVSVRPASTGGAR